MESSAAGLMSKKLSEASVGKEKRSRDRHGEERRYAHSPTVGARADRPGSSDEEDNMLDQAVVTGPASD